MRYIFWQHSLIFIISLAMGFIGFSQYSSIQSQKTQFTENNPFRELRILIDSNRDMEGKVKDLNGQLSRLQTEEQVVNNAKTQINQALNFAGSQIDNKGFITVLWEGEVTLNDFISIINTFWNNGVENMEINSVKVNYANSGIDTAGGQFLIGGTPISAPFLFKLYGNPEMLLKTLDPDQGALAQFKNNKTKITVSSK